MRSTPGEEMCQAGQNGVEQVCYRILIEDGVRREPVETSRIITLAPQNEIVFVGPTEELEPVPVTGTLAYVNNNNAWVMRGNSTTKRPLTITSDLDERVFSLSPDGRQLLIARNTGDESTFGNQLWLITDITSQTVEPISLTRMPADGLGGNHNQLFNGEPRDTPQAVGSKRLLVMRIDPRWNTSSINELWERLAEGVWLVGNTLQWSWQEINWLDTGRSLALLTWREGDWITLRVCR
jgi:hypothetical protein